jgi:lysyl-tRNA synthetase class 2
VEVETPVRVPAPALEEHIDAVPSGACWLRTSPELHMKRLVAGGAGRIFQLGPCFRAGEHGRRHRTEFTMLEWYCSPGDYLDVLRQTRGLLAAAAAACGFAGRYQGAPLDLTAEPELLTVDEAFRRYTGCPVHEALAGDQFELLLVERVEPHLGRGRPTFLLDYPVELGALARAKPGAPQWAERWELYLAGLELANAFSELTDAAEQRRRFAAAAEYRGRAGREVYPLDEAFLAALDAGLPPTGGCALGFDRLLMILADTTDMADVRLFPE